MSRQSRIEDEKPIVAAGPQLIVAREQLRKIQADPIHEFETKKFKIQIQVQSQSLWIFVRWPHGGTITARPVLAPGTKFEIVDVRRDDNHSIHLSVDTSIGIFHVQINLPATTEPLLHWRTSIVPNESLRIADWPTDVFPLDEHLDPFGVAGAVHTSQKGPTGAILYATMTRPWRGSLMYVQNLTALNEYFERTKTSGKNCISSNWPELGFMLPASLEHPLPAGQETVISDAYLLVTAEAPENKIQAARLFLELYAQVYLVLPKPDPQFRDWPRLVDQTIRDLTHSNACVVEKAENRFLLAYVGAKDRPPESMVQLAVLLPMIEYSNWLGEELPAAEQIRANLPRFYRPDVKTVVRWLPGEENLLGSEEHMGEEVMDSWYLYHTYLNLSRLAKDGDQIARRLFLDSVDYGMSVARHFSYHWPVFYNIHTLDPIKSQTEPGMGGEHDVGAQYVHVMMQAWDLTGDKRFLDEAERSAAALEGLGFELGYQFNNTSFGAGGLLRLWKATGNELYRDLSYVCLANVVRNFWLWECSYGHAKHYHTFMGVVPLRNAEYLAVYEELETLAAFHDYLALGGNDVLQSARLLLCEFCKYAIDRAWYYYPEHLPRDIVEEKPRSGHINRELTIPLEDIYDGWQKAGKVGQEVYGAAAPFVFATRHCHHINGVKFRVHSDYPLTNFTVKRLRHQRISRAGKVEMQLAGDRRCRAHIRVVPDDYTPLPKFDLKVRRGKSWHSIVGEMNENGYWEFEVLGNAEIALTWNAKSGAAHRARSETNGTINSGRPRPRNHRQARRT
jgi:hypothetical protein